MATEKDPPCQSCTADPNYAIICSFFEKFSAKCGISHFNFLELQEMLENTVEVRQPLVDLHIKLLRKARKNCSADKWERVVTKFCHSYSKQDGWELERFGYKNSRIEVKLRLLKHLLEAQFDSNSKFKSDVNKLSATELRVEPLGRDKNGQTYWCQFDPSSNIRIYKEDPDDEESWDLIARDRDGLVNLIDDLSSGEGQKELNSILNDDSNSQEIEKPIIDTGQVSSATSPPEVATDESLSQEVKQYSDSTNGSADAGTASDVKEPTVNSDSDSNSRHPVQSEAATAQSESALDKSLAPDKSVAPEKSVVTDKNVASDKIVGQDKNVEAEKPKISDDPSQPPEKIVESDIVKDTVQEAKIDTVKVPIQDNKIAESKVEKSNVPIEDKVSPEVAITVAKVKEKIPEAPKEKINIPLKSVSITKVENSSKTEVSVRPVPLSVAELKSKADVKSKANEVLDNRVENLVKSEDSKLSDSVGEDLSMKSVKKSDEALVSDLSKGSVSILPREESKSKRVPSNGSDQSSNGSEDDACGRLSKINSLVESIKSVGGMNRVHLSKKSKGPPGSKLDEIFKFKRVHDPTTPTNLPPQSQPIPAYISPGVKDSVLAQMKDGLGTTDEKREVTISRVIPEQRSSRLEERLGEITQRLGMRQVEIKPVKTSHAESMQAEDLTKPKIKPKEEKIEPESKKLKLAREAEFSEAVEEPLMLVRGEGSGADCNTANPSLCLDFLQTSSRDFNNEPEFGEAIEEPMMFFYGEGSGMECDTGNPDLEKKSEEMSSKNEENCKEEVNSENSQDKKGHKLWSIDAMCNKKKENNCENSEENQESDGASEKPSSAELEVISNNNSVDEAETNITSDKSDNKNEKLAKSESNKGQDEEMLKNCNNEESKTENRDKEPSDNINKDDFNEKETTCSEPDVKQKTEAQKSKCDGKKVDKKASVKSQSKNKICDEVSKTSKSDLEEDPEKPKTILKKGDLQEKADEKTQDKQIEETENRMKDIKKEDDLEDKEKDTKEELGKSVDDTEIQIESKKDVKVESNVDETDTKEDIKKENVVCEMAKDTKCKEKIKEEDLEGNVDVLKSKSKSRANRNRRTSRADIELIKNSETLVEETSDTRRSRRSAALISSQLSENIIKPKPKNIKKPAPQTKEENLKNEEDHKDDSKTKEDDTKAGAKQKSALKGKKPPAKRSGSRKSSAAKDEGSEPEKVEENEPKEEPAKTLGLNSFSFDVDDCGNVPIPEFLTRKRKVEDEVSADEDDDDDDDDDDEPLSIKRSKSAKASRSKRKSKGWSPKKRARAKKDKDDDDEKTTPTKQMTKEDMASEVTPRSRKPQIKTKTLLGLTPRDLAGVDVANSGELSASGRSVRTSRRIAQIKIKEQEEERKMHEMTMKEINNAREREKQIKKNKDLMFKEMTHSRGGRYKWDRRRKPIMTPTTNKQIPRKEPKIKEKKQKTVIVKKETTKDPDKTYKASIKENKEEKKAKKKKSSAKVSDGDFTPHDQDSNDTLRKKKGRPKKKKDKFRYDHNNPWKSSSGSGSSEEDNDDLEHFDLEEDDEEDDLRAKEPVSDHEFSPESDLEGEDADKVPVRHARTALKGVVEDKQEEDDTACQKCSKSDHPEWILLCDKCDKGWHGSCLRPALMIVPEGDWFCPPCQHLQLVEKLKETLRIFEKDSKRRENDELRRKRLAYVGISLSNVLPPPGTKVKLDDSSSSSSGSSRSDDSRSGSSSESSSYEDEPVYQLRARRQTNQSYRFNDYDQLINSAIQDEMEAVAGAGNQGRGKDIENIVEAERKEANGLDGAKQNEEDEEEGEEGWRPAVVRNRGSGALSGGRKKSRKLTNIDVSSEDDQDSDEDFKGSSSSSEEEESNSDYSSGSGRRSKWKSQPVRRSTRARRSRVDREFINDDSEDSDAPKKKKSRRVWSESESSESDETWGQRKKKAAVSRGSNKTRRKKKNKYSDSYDSDSPPPRKSKSKKPKKRSVGVSSSKNVRQGSSLPFSYVYTELDPSLQVKYGMSDDEDYGRKTRGKKINYQESESEDNIIDNAEPAPPPVVVKTRRVIESDDEETYKPEPSNRKKNVLSDTEDEDDDDDDATEEEEEEEEEGDDNIEDEPEDQEDVLSNIKENVQPDKEKEKIPETKEANPPNKSAPVEPRPKQLPPKEPEVKKPEPCVSTASKAPTITAQPVKTPSSVIAPAPKPIPAQPEPVKSKPDPPRTTIVLSKPEDRDMEMFVGDVEEEIEEEEEEEEEELEEEDLLEEDVEDEDLEEEIEPKRPMVKLNIPSPVRALENKPQISLTIKPVESLKAVKEKVVEEELEEELSAIPGPIPKVVPVPVPASEIKESVKEVEKLEEKVEKKPDPPKVNTIRIVPQHKLMANPPPQLEVKSMLMRPRVPGPHNMAGYPGMRYPPRPHMMRPPPQYPSQYPSQYLPYYSHHYPPDEYPPGYCPTGSVHPQAPPQQLPHPVPYGQPDEGEFGGLVSYFSSQHEDNIDS